MSTDIEIRKVTSWPAKTFFYRLQSEQLPFRATAYGGAMLLAFSSEDQAEEWKQNHGSDDMILMPHETDVDTIRTLRAMVLGDVIRVTLDPSPSVGELIAYSIPEVIQFLLDRPRE